MWAVGSALLCGSLRLFAWLWNGKSLVRTSPKESGSKGLYNWKPNLGTSPLSSGFLAVGTICLFFSGNGFSLTPTSSVTNEAFCNRLTVLGVPIKPSRTDTTLTIERVGKLDTWYRCKCKPGQVPSYCEKLFP